MRPHKRQRTESYTNAYTGDITQEASDLLNDREAMEPLADKELRKCSRKLPEASRSHVNVPREDIIPDSTSCAAAETEQLLWQEMQIPDEFNISDDEITLLQTAMDHPPVTKQTLSELDITCILNNINLRVDINFDHDLHFMPVKGKKGDQKRREARMYWAALALELELYRFAATQPKSSTESCLQLGRLRLPQMFVDLKELLLTLIPQDEAAVIDEVLDIPLLMQQIEHGVLDIANLARWLADLLKSHCAPMRDVWADEMVTRVEHGIVSQNTRFIVAGLEKLFSILEAMKLDVANHQIRSLRIWLIENTVSFQQKHFRRNLEDGKVDINATRKWYDEAQQNHFHCSEGQCQGDGDFAFASLVHGLTSQFTAFGGTCKYPIVFQYDWNRLQQLRGEVQNLIHLDLCCAMFKNLINVQGPLPVRHSNLKSAVEQFRSRLCSLLGDTLRSLDCVEKIWQSSTDTISLELVRALYVLQGRSITDISHKEVSWVEQRLTQLFQGQYSELYDRLVNNIHEQIERSTMAHAKNFQNMSTFAIAEYQRKRRTVGDTQVSRTAPDVEDVAKRIAHIAVLNWDIYADVVYNSTELHAASKRSVLATAGSPQQVRRRLAFSFSEQAGPESITRPVEKPGIG